MEGVTEYTVEPCPLACESLGHTVTITGAADSAPVATLRAIPVKLSPVAMNVDSVLIAEQNRLIPRPSDRRPQAARTIASALLAGMQAERTPPGGALPEHRVAVRCPVKDKWFVLRVPVPNGAHAVHVIRVTTKPKPPQAMPLRETGGGSG